METLLDCSVSVMKRVKICCYNSEALLDFSYIRLRNKSNFKHALHSAQIREIPADSTFALQT